MAAAVFYLIALFAGRKSGSPCVVKPPDTGATADMPQASLAPVFCAGAAAVAGWSAYASGTANPLPVVIFVLIIALALVYALLCGIPAGKADM